jgi:hypothetical protein
MDQSKQQLARRLRQVIVAIVIFVPVAFIFVAVNVYNHIDDAYAQWGAADMVVQYMVDHNDEWPKSWSLLQTYFDKNNGHVGGWSFAQFQSRVFIDFDADSAQLRRLSFESGSVPFDVIHAVSIWGAQLGGGPNEIIYRYFRNSKHDKPANL